MSREPNPAPTAAVLRRRWYRRGPLEVAAMLLIGAGTVMMTQPFSFWLFQHSFAVTLTGTIAFVIVSHFPEA